MNIGVNLFGANRELKEDFSGALAAIKKAGAGTVETCIYFQIDKNIKNDSIQYMSAFFKEFSGGIWPYEEAEEKIKIVRAMGFKVTGTHFFALTDSLPSVIPCLIDFCKKNDLKHLVLSLMLDSAAAASGHINALNTMISAFKAEGITLNYHNHTKDGNMDGGQTVLEYLLDSCPELALQLDVGWAVFSNNDPVKLIEKYRSRIHTIHLKDYYPGTYREGEEVPNCALGEGCVNIRRIIQKARELGISDDCYIIDADNAKEDVMKDYETGIRNILSY